MSRLRQKRARRDRAIGLLLGALGILLIGALLAGVWWVKASRVQLDASTNCPLTGPHAIHVIMIDRSDPISGQQAQRIKQDIQEAKDRAPFGTRFDLYTFEGDLEHAMLSVAQVCVPGKPNEANALIEAPERVRALYEERFSKPLDSAIDNLLVASTRPVSPILESLRAAAQTSLGPVSEGLPLRLTIVSDLIQHSSTWSHYRSAPDFEAMSRSFAWSSLRPQLKGAHVDVLYLLRPNATRNGSPIQSRGHQGFWEKVIQAGGGTLDRVEPL